VPKNHHPNHHKKPQTHHELTTKKPSPGTQIPQNPRKNQASTTPFF
jgi:hypothetical protein